MDGVDLSLVPRSVVRQRCFITVGQDPFVLGQVSLRFNLDVRTWYFHVLKNHTNQPPLSSPLAPLRTKPL